MSIPNALDNHADRLDALEQRQIDTIERQNKIIERQARAIDALLDRLGIEVADVQAS